MNYTVLYFVLETSRITSLKAHTVNCTDCDKRPGLARYPNQLTVPNWSHVGHVRLRHSDKNVFTQLRGKVQ